MPTLTAHGYDLTGTAANRPTEADPGVTYYATDTGVYSIYTGSAWVALGSNNTLGAKNGSAVAAVEKSGVVQQTKLTLTDLSVTMTDATTNGCHGSHKLYDFPAGAITIIGATMNLTTLAGSGGISDTAALIGSLGTATVGTNNATLTSTEADVVPSTTGTLTDGAGTLAGVGTTALIASFDGTSTAKDLYLNLAVPDGDSSASDTVAVSGTITVTWVNHGDI